MEYNANAAPKSRPLNGSRQVQLQTGNPSDGPLPPSLESIRSGAGEGTQYGIVENVESRSQEFNEFNQFNETEVPERIHSIPEDSILANIRDLAREFSEGPDCFAIAPALALIGGALTPNTWWGFAGGKFLNLFQFVVGPPGIRKSTSFKLALLVGKAALPPERFHEGNASDSAAFAKWHDQPHRIQLESEGNTLVTAWRSSYSGREIAARCLRLYDGESWSQTYRHQADSDGDGAEQRIDCATLSLAIGATPSVCRFEGVDAKSGLRRRFGYYAATSPARVIPWPKEIEQCSHLEEIIEGVRRIAELEGKFTFDKGAERMWNMLQMQNRERIAKLGEPANESAEIEAAELSECPSRVLKLAAIFQASRWAKKTVRSALVVDGHSLAVAAEHQDACIEASRSVERIAHRAASSEEADRILATIRSEASSLRDSDRWRIEDDCILASKSDITRRFAANGSRSPLTASRLHAEIMPTVIRLAGGRVEKKGAGTIYRIPMESQL